MCNSADCLSFQAIAIVFGFLVVAALIIMLVFALKTRQKINNFGKSNILWKKVKVVDEMGPPNDVEAWVSDGDRSFNRTRDESICRSVEKCRSGDNAQHDFPETQSDVQLTVQNPKDD